MIISRNEVEKLINNTDFDQSIAEMAVSAPIVCLHPNVPDHFLSLLDLNLDVESFGIRYTSNGKWLAKKFPCLWNGRFKNIELDIPPVDVYVHPRAKEFYSKLEFKPDGWNLNYQHIWLFADTLTEGVYVEAVKIKYSDSARDSMVVDTVREVSNNFDVFFLSYSESNAEENYQRLLTKTSNVRRISNIKGIYNAHKEAASQSTTDYFYVVDADAYITDEFTFADHIGITTEPRIQIWYSRNTVNHLEYGYGGVKFFPKEIFLKDAVVPLDVATGIAPLKVDKRISCETRFNSSEFNAWKGAFREVVKLASGKIKNQISIETANRLQTWITKVDQEAPFAKFVLEGAGAGLEYCKLNYTDLNALALINDVVWLREKFTESYPDVPIR
jgi:hypothetical protein